MLRAWYGYDGQGSARQLLNDAGHVTASASYDPYGSPEGAALPSPFGYTGELTDPATGSQYLRARWYRPGQGSLLGVDPALDSTGQPYSYASDNPANGSDPSGRCTVHLAGTEYSYLGAEGAGPCSAGLTSTLEAISPQGNGIPCPNRIDTGRLEVLTPGQTQTLASSASASGGGGATAASGAGAVAIVGGAAVGAEEGTLPWLGLAGPPGWFVAGVVVLITLGVLLFVGSHATSATTDCTSGDCRDRGCPPGTLETAKIRYSQAFASKNFKDGKFTLSGTIEQLRQNPTYEIADRIRVFVKKPFMNAWGAMSKNGYHGDPQNLLDTAIYTLDNRRLYTYKAAGRRCIPVVPAGFAMIREERWKFDTTNYGVSISIRA